MFDPSTGTILEGNTVMEDAEAKCSRNGRDICAFSCPGGGPGNGVSTAAARDAYKTAGIMKFSIGSHRSRHWPPGLEAMATTRSLR
jgi:hypothetical protein